MTWGHRQQLVGYQLIMTAAPAVLGASAVSPVLDPLFLELSSMG